MRSDQVNIDSPCHESWEAMEGGAERRFCGVCDKHVHNLSAMNMADAHALLRASAGQHLCVRYSAEADGALRFRDLVPKSRLTRGLLRAAFAATMLAACGPGDARPVADLGDAMIESLQVATTPRPDGGCDLSTGPFTTFHLPPGHVLCLGVGDVADPPGAALVPTATPPVPDPIEHPTMGEAVALPPSDTFVPCDPKPGLAPNFAQPPSRFAPNGFAPPPPPRFAPPPEPPPMRMGDIAAPPVIKDPPPPPPMIQGGISFVEPPPPPPPEPRFAPPPGPRFAPPPPGFAPPPPDHPKMGSVSAPDDDRALMGRVAPAR